MRYYYVPSTYRGRKFGKGFAGGGNFRGCGRICGGSLVDLNDPSPSAPPMTVDIPIQPVQIEENLLAIPDITDEIIERAQKIVAYAEATGRAKPITKKDASLWSGIKNLGSKAWNATKNAAVAVASNPIVQTGVKYGVPLAMNAVMPAVSPYITSAISNALAPKKEEPKISDPATEGASSFFDSGAMERLFHPERFVRKPPEKTGLWGSLKKWWSGSGYRAGAYRAGAYRAGAYRAGAYRGGKLKKGSLEAKLYMARLRAMRGKSKKRSGKKGGMFRGVKRNDLQALIDEAKNAKMPSIFVRWEDKNKKPHTTEVMLDKAENMIRATDDLINYYKYKNKDENGKWSDKRTAEEIKAFRKANREAEGRKTWKAGDLYKRWGAKRNRILMRQLEDITGDNRKKKWDDMIAYWKERSDPKLYNYIFGKSDEKREQEPKLGYKIRRDVRPLIDDMTTLMEQRMVELNIKSNIVDNIADAVAVAQEAADIAQDAADDAPDALVPVTQAAADAAALNAQQAKQAVTTQQAIGHAQAAVSAADTAVNAVKTAEGIGKKKKKNKRKKQKHSTLKASLEAEKRALKKAIKSSPLKGKVIVDNLNDVNDADSYVNDPLADIGLSGYVNDE